MRTRVKYTSILLLPLAWGCTPPQTSVELENKTGGELHVTVFFAENQNISENLIAGAQKESFTIPNGESRSFARNCDDLQAVKVEADVNLLAGLGPSNNTGVFRAGSDFGCSDVLHFTFTATILPPRLTIDFEKR